MSTYKYASPIEWFQDKYIHRISSSELHTLVCELASKLDGDQLQDMFQAEMDADGYFKDLDKMFPALFVIDPTSGEADGTVYHFCTDKCRNEFNVGTGQVKAADSKDFVDGTVCDECGNELPY